MDLQNIKDDLLAHAGQLFRAAWGEPENPGARQWRAKLSSAQSMAMSGPKQGLWHDFTADVGGDILDFFAIHICDLPNAKSDFPRVLREAAAWCGTDFSKGSNALTRNAQKRARDAEAANDATKELARKERDVKCVQDHAEPALETPAALYLACRSITEVPPGFFYLPPSDNLPLKDRHRGALVVFATDATGAVRGGQRILIMPNGSKAPEHKTKNGAGKRAFGSINGYPLRIPPKSDTLAIGPLCIAEGPETAAAIWQATGYETCAVFGVSSFKNVPLPLDRKVIFCPDQDAGGSPADRTFAKAVAHHLAQRVDVWIAKAPEPEGSKRDFNDTLRRAGNAAVAMAIDAAVKAGPPEPVETKTLSTWSALPAPAPLPNGKTVTLERALRECRVGDDKNLAVALAVALKLLLKSPVEMSIRDIKRFLEKHLPEGAVTKGEVDAIMAELDRSQARRRERAMTPVSIPEAIKQRHQVEEVPKLQALPSQDLSGVICIRAPMGSGKTQTIGRPFIEAARKAGASAMAICHRITLTAELARRLELADYQTADLATISAAGGVAVCLPSITKTEILEAMPSPRYVFIDEIAQVLRFLETQICGTRNANAKQVFDRLVQIIRDAEAVVVADAGLDGRTIEFLEYCRPGEQFRIIDMPPTSTGTSAKVIFDQINKVREAVVSEVLAELLRGGKVWLAVESKKFASVLAQYFGKDFRVLAVTADNKVGADQKAFLANAEEASRNYDVVIASPVISSGISVEHHGRPWFTLGAYIGMGCATSPSDAMQQMCRVRYLRNFIVGIERNNLVGGEQAKCILTGLEAASVVEGSVVRAGPYDELVAGIRAEQINAKADFAAGLWWQMEAAGWFVQPHMKTSLGGGGTLLQEIAFDQEMRHREALRTADPIDDATAEFLKSRARSPADEIRLEAWTIRRALGVIDLDDATLDLWDEGRGERRIERYEDLTEANVVRCDTGTVLVHRKLRQARMRLDADLFAGIDITRKDWGTPEVQALLLDRFMERPDVFVAVGIVGSKWRSRCMGKGGHLQPPKRPTGRRITWFMKELLAAVGLKWVSKRRRMPISADKAAGSDNRAWIGGTCSESLRTMQEIMTRRRAGEYADRAEAIELAWSSVAHDTHLLKKPEIEASLDLEWDPRPVVPMEPNQGPGVRGQGQVHSDEVSGPRATGGADWAEALAGYVQGEVGAQARPETAGLARSAPWAHKRGRGTATASLSKALVVQKGADADDGGGRAIRGIGLIPDAFRSWWALDLPGNPEAFA